MVMARDFQQRVLGLICRPCGIWVEFVVCSLAPRVFLRIPHVLSFAKSNATYPHSNLIWIYMYRTYTKLPASDVAFLSKYHEFVWYFKIIIFISQPNQWCFIILSLLFGTWIFAVYFQFKRVHHAVEASGGSTLLRDVPGSESDDGLVSKDVCIMMMDSKEQSTLPAESQQWIVHVTETLRRFVLVNWLGASQGCWSIFFKILFNFFLCVDTGADLSQSLSLD